jgi:hypothetical protein
MEAEAAGRVHKVQEELRQVHTEDSDTSVPTRARDLTTQLKDALSCAADAVLAAAPASADPAALQARLAELLHANPAEPPPNTVILKDDHRFDEVLGGYGHNLRVRVARPPNAAAFVSAEFSINVPCGEDHALLLYGFRDGGWSEQIRWQAPPLAQISDAFGGFFLSAVLPSPEGAASGPRLVVVHGSPWCTSRFSGFQIDVLSPTSSPASPKVLWHTARAYSRGEFEPTLKSSADTFELRLNASCMDPNAFERRVIYRYRVDERGEVRRLEPIGTNARNFVEEWLSAPWPESQLFAAPDAAAALHPVHDHFAPPAGADAKFVAHTYGPVRACTATGAFQVQIDSEEETSYYFHVREIKDGYLMLSATREPDAACKGADLMAPKR